MIRNWKHFTPKPVRRFFSFFFQETEQEGVYGLFFVVMSLGLLVAVGIAIDGPRHLTANQRVEDVANEAARYAASLIVQGVEHGDVVRRTEVFVSRELTGSNQALSLTGTGCNEESGEYTVSVRGEIRNTLSAIIFGPRRVFNAEGRAGLLYFPPNGEIDPEENINICSVPSAISGTTPLG